MIKEKGMVLECFFASDTPKSEDFWIHRMNLLIELADIVILIDIEPSIQTKHEIAKTITEHRRHFRPALSRLLGVDFERINIALGKSKIIIIKESDGEKGVKRKRRYTVVYFSRNEKPENFRKILDNQLEVLIASKARTLIRTKILTRKLESGFLRTLGFIALTLGFLKTKPESIGLLTMLGKLVKDIGPSKEFGSSRRLYDDIAKLLFMGLTVTEIQTVVQVAKSRKISILDTLRIMRRLEKIKGGLESLFSKLEYEPFEAGEFEEFDGWSDDQLNAPVGSAADVNAHHALNLRLKQEQLVSPKRFRTLYGIYKPHYIEQFETTFGPVLSRMKFFKILTIYCSSGRSVEVMWTAWRFKSILRDI